MQVNQLPIKDAQNPGRITSRPMVKTSFLVFKHNKYLIIPVETIAAFYIRDNVSVLLCFNREEFTLSQSLNRIQTLISEQQFFRLNRQCLINLGIIRDVEHYFARKLLVNPVIPLPEKLLVPAEKTTEFLNWLDNR